MTPLADLGFLLITFFMFTTTFSKPNVMGLNMPPKNIDKPIDPPLVKNENTLTLILGKDDKVFWHQLDKSLLTLDKISETNYSREGLREIIKTAKSNAPDKELFTIIIKPTDDATYENVVNTLDEMEITESTKYGIVDIPTWELDLYEQKSGTSSSNP